MTSEKCTKFGANRKTRILLRLAFSLWVAFSSAPAEAVFEFGGYLHAMGNACNTWLTPTPRPPKALRAVTVDWRAVHGAPEAVAELRRDPTLVEDVVGYLYRVHARKPSNFQEGQYLDAELKKSFEVLKLYDPNLAAWAGIEVLRRTPRWKSGLNDLFLTNVESLLGNSGEAIHGARIPEYFRAIRNPVLFSEIMRDPNYEGAFLRILKRGFELNDVTNFALPRPEDIRFLSDAKIEEYSSILRTSSRRRQEYDYAKAYDSIRGYTDILEDVLARFPGNEAAIARYREIRESLPKRFEGTFDRNYLNGWANWLDQVR